MDRAAESAFSVTVADIRGDALEALQRRASVKTIQADLSDQSKVRALVAHSDLVVNAVPGHMAFRVLRTLIEAGKHVVAARMLHRGLYDAKGILPPEFIWQHPQRIEFMLCELAQRGINYVSRVN